MDASPADDALRERLAASLVDRLATEWRDRADSGDAVNRIAARLAAVAPGDHAALLRIAGFTPAPFEPAGADDIAQACETCMYCAPHRRFCELPELHLPVRPEMSCRVAHLAALTGRR